jgi:hypothetical protein
MTDDGWYTAGDTPELVELGSAAGLSVTGRGAPGEQSYVGSLRALYAVAGQANPAAPPPLEGRWWVEDDRPPFDVPRHEWCWHLFLRLPDGVGAAQVEAARERALAGGAPHAANRVQLVTWHGGRCVQVMHRGPYADEPRTLATMDGFMRTAGLAHAGLHHEIYLTDVNAPPEHARTILRQPVVRRAQTTGRATHRHRGWRSTDPSSTPPA